MEFNLTRSLQILERTPRVLTQLLTGLDDEWVMQNEGPDTWSPFDIVGHLLHGEKTDWIARVNKVLSNGEDKRFIPFDRFAQFEESKGKNLDQLLEEFSAARHENLEKLRSFNITDHHLKQTGIHPKFGEVTLSELLSTWTIHDLTHIAQVTRVMAKQYKDAIGPWIEFFRIMQ